VLKHLVPLVRGAGHVVLYSPTVEPLARVMDLYSRDRKAAFIARMVERSEEREKGGAETGKRKSDGNAKVDEQEEEEEDEDFPVDPRLLLAPTLQTTRVRPWQVLPGRTHPVMGMRGGAEGYVFTARRVLPIEGRVEARGNYAKKRKVG